MITFSKLGKYGRLGNQLFQISTVVAHGKRYGYGFAFPEWDYNKYLEIPLPRVSSIEGFKNFNERDPWNYSAIPLENNLDLHGYFQNALYFDDYKRDLLEILKPKSEILDGISQKIRDLGSKRITAIHVRRGDYLKFPNHHPIPSIEYYNSSIERLKPYTDIFMVFSDDIQWCKENLAGQFIYSEETDEFIDLYKMSMCDNFIIANSSFSWWGSYLSDKDGKVMAPSQWVGVEYRNKGWRGVYRKEMILI